VGRSQEGEFKRCVMAVQKLCLALLCSLLLILSLSSCGVTQEEHAAVTVELPSPQGEGKDRQDELVPLQSEVESPGEELNTSEKELNTTVTLSYPFTYQGDEYHWLLNIPSRDYIYYKEKPRPYGFSEYAIMMADPYTSYTYFSEYSAMAADPNDDGIINSIVNNLNEAASTKGLSELDKASLVLKFVQSLTYAEDADTTVYNEYPRFPVETLFEQRGDCEDTSILAAAILTATGYDTALLLFHKYDHMGVGINLPAKYGNSWIHNGKRYWYFDTSGGRSIGWCPKEYADTPAYVFPVGWTER